MSFPMENGEVAITSNGFVYVGQYEYREGVVVVSTHYLGTRALPCAGLAPDAVARSVLRELAEQEQVA